MLYCLDCYGPEGSAGKSGTSCTAMMFLSNWLQGLGDIGKLPVSSRYLRGSDVYVGDNSLLLDALHRGGAVVVRLYYEVAHYVLFTGVKDGQILLFDPYYQTVPFTKPDEKATIVATGGLAKRIIPLCRHRIELDDELLLRGLWIIYEKNK